MVKCESKLIAAFGFVEDMLLIVFKNGPGVVYVYHGVPEKVIEGFVAAESKGKYFTQHVKNKYPFKKET